MNEVLYKIIRKLIVAIVVLAVILFATNMIWLYAWTQYEYVGEETSVINKNGISNFIGNDGVIDND